MCVLFVAWQVRPETPLIVASNRDEAHARPTAPADWWPDCPNVLAGRDLEAGGTWGGVNRNGHWAIVTNVREPRWFGYEAERSRGRLVADVLCGESAPAEDAARAVAEQEAYAGFNLLVGDRETLWYAATGQRAPQALAPGFYGLSNAALDTPWPKIARGGAAFQTWVEDGAADDEALFAIMRDETRADDDALPSTGVGRAHERVLSPLFIRSLDYGTRATTLLRFGASGRMDFAERPFGPNGAPGTERRYTVETS